MNGSFGMKTTLVLDAGSFHAEGPADFLPVDWAFPCCSALIWFKGSLNV